MTTPKRNILITGAGSGLGRGLSLCLARAGHSIIATDVDLEHVQETVAEIKASGGQAGAFGLNVTAEPQIQRLLADSRETRIEVLTARVIRNVPFNITSSSKSHFSSGNSSTLDGGWTAQ